MTHQCFLQILSKLNFFMIIPIVTSSGLAAQNLTNDPLFELRMSYVQYNNCSTSGSFYGDTPHIITAHFQTTIIVRLYNTEAT